jgi:hypothetical protein
MPTLGESPAPNDNRRDFNNQPKELEDMNMSHPKIKSIPWGKCKCGTEATIKARTGISKGVWSKPVLWCAICYNKHLDESFPKVYSPTNP